MMEEVLQLRNRLEKIYIVAMIVIFAASMTLMLHYASKKVVFVTAEEAQAQAEALETETLTKTVKASRSFILELRSSAHDSTFLVPLPSSVKYEDVHVSARPDLKIMTVRTAGDLTDHFLKDPPVGDFDDVGKVDVIYDGSETMLKFELAGPIYPAVSRSGNSVKVSLAPIDTSKPVVIIDPCYGGSQPGTVAGSDAEKDINLRLAKIIAEKCSDRDYNVYLTRTTDETILTEERLDIVNVLGADYYIGLSLESDFEDTKNFGMSAVYNSHYYRNGYENVDFADEVLRSAAISASDRANGLFEADPDDVILMALEIPAVRFNAGMITNINEARLLIRDEYLDRIATGIADAIDVATKQ